MAPTPTVNAALAMVVRRETACWVPMVRERKKRESQRGLRVVICEGGGISDHEEERKKRK